MLKQHKHSTARSIAGFLVLAAMSMTAVALSSSAFALDSQTERTSRAEPVQFESALTALKRVAPKYPAEAVKAAMEGQVKLVFTIDKQGYTRDIRVVESRPGTMFDQAAIDALKQWRFKPVMVNGELRAVEVRQALEFKLPKSAN